jgi:hypothetical protein
VHDASGEVAGTVCALNDAARDYSESDLAELRKRRGQVEDIVARDGAALTSPSG